MCVSTVCGLLVCLTFACSVILFGSVMSFILPVNIGVGDGGHVPPKFVNTYFGGQLLRKIRTFFGQKLCKIQEYCYVIGQIA